MNDLKLILMIGVSGSGKSTIADKISLETGAVKISTDDIRFELTGNAEDQSKNSLVFSTAKKRVDENLSKGASVIIDATNLNVKDRKDFIFVGKKYGAEVTAHVVQVPIEVAKERNAKRTRVVPSDVIDRQFNKFVSPSLSEGIDVVKVIIN